MSWTILSYLQPYLPWILTGIGVFFILLCFSFFRSMIWALWGGLGEIVVVVLEGLLELFLLAFTSLPGFIVLAVVGLVFATLLDNEHFTGLIGAAGAIIFLAGLFLNAWKTHQDTYPPPDHHKK